MEIRPDQKEIWSVCGDLLRIHDIADTMATESLQPMRRIGMLLGVVGLAISVAATPILFIRATGTSGFVWVITGWTGFALGATLFATALGLVAIMMPALGELAEIGAVSPQQVADQMIRQSPIIASFFGGNILFLSWVAIDVGLVRIPEFPIWLGWVVILAAFVGWLSFLHVQILGNASRYSTISTAD